MRKLGDGDIGDGVGPGGLGMGEQTAQRLELGAHEPGPVQPRERCGLVAAEQGDAIGGRGGQLGACGQREHRQDRLVGAERGAHHGDEPVDVGLPLAQRAGLQLVGRRDPLGEQRRDVVGLLPEGLGVGGRRRQRVDADELAHRVERAAQRPGLPRRRRHRGVRLAQCGEHGVGPLTQLSVVDRAGRPGRAGTGTPGRAPVGHLQRPAAAHQP